MNNKDITITFEIDTFTLTETRDVDGKAMNGANIPCGLYVSQDTAQFLILDAKGQEIASVVLEAWDGKVQVRAYKASPTYGADEPIKIVLLEIGGAQ